MISFFVVAAICWRLLQSQTKNCSLTKSHNTVNGRFSLLLYLSKEFQYFVCTISFHLPYLYLDIRDGSGILPLDNLAYKWVRPLSPMKFMFLTKIVSHRVPMWIIWTWEGHMSANSKQLSFISSERSISKHINWGLIWRVHCASRWYPLLVSLYYLL